MSFWCCTRLKNFPNREEKRQTRKYENCVWCRCTKMQRVPQLTGFHVHLQPHLSKPKLKRLQASLDATQSAPVFNSSARAGFWRCVFWRIHQFICLTHHLPDTYLSCKQFLKPKCSRIPEVTLLYAFSIPSLKKDCICVICFNEQKYNSSRLVLSHYF